MTGEGEGSGAAVVPAAVPTVTAAPDAVAPERRRWPLVAVLAAHAVSATGNVLTVIAVPWFVLQTTGSAARTGVAAAAATIPIALSALFGGALVDRVGYVRTSVAADLASGLTVAMIPVLFAAGLLPFWALLALVFLSGLLDAPGATARSALLPDLAGLAGTSLERASSAFDAVERGARMLGAPLAGLLIAGIGATAVLAVDAATFAVSALLVAAARVPATVRTPDEGRSYVGRLREGLAFIAADPLIRAIVLMVMVTNLLDAAYLGVVVPVYADRLLGGATDLGWLLGVFGAGALGGAVLFGAVGERMPRWATFTVAFLIAGPVRWFVMAAEPGLAVLLVTVGLSGLAAGVINPILSTIEYERIPIGMRARVLGAITAGVMVATPLGALVAGPLIEVAGLTTTLLCLGGAYLLTTLSPLLGRTWRQMDRPARRESLAASAP